MSEVVVVKPKLVETNCALCARLLKLTLVTPDIPDFCISCYMTHIHPESEKIMQSTPAGQQMPEMVALVKHIMAGLDTCRQ